MREKLYRNITKPSRLFGLELTNLAVFVVAAPLLLRFIGNTMLGAALSAGLYLLIRRYERGKPAGYTLTLIQYFLSAERYRVELEEENKKAGLSADLLVGSYRAVNPIDTHF